MRNEKTNCSCRLWKLLFKPIIFRYAIRRDSWAKQLAKWSETRQRETVWYTLAIILLMCLESFAKIAQENYSQNNDDDDYNAYSFDASFVIQSHSSKRYQTLNLSWGKTKRNEKKHKNETETNNIKKKKKESRARDINWDHLFSKAPRVHHQWLRHILFETSKLASKLSRHTKVRKKCLSIFIFAFVLQTFSFL